MAIKPLNSVAGFSVGETPANIILANGDITTTNITTTGVANLNAIGNVKMSGGSSGQVIQTDGAGNLSFVTISTSSLQNGTSNIQVLSSANLTFSSAGNANVVVITGSGEVVNGTLSVVGNANIGNIGTGLITATGNITGANLFTGGILSATGNANVGNLGTAGLITATGNIGGGNINTGGIVSATGNANVGNVNTTGVFATTLSSTGNANVGNLGTGGLITATGNITGGNIVTAGTANAAILTVSGNANIGNIGTAGVITAGGTVTGGNLATAGTLSVGGNANVGNIGTTNLVATGGGSFGSNLNMNSFNIVSLATPTNPADATTKQYVDDLVATGLAYHEPVYVATVGTLATATGGTMTYNNGTAGVGATLTTTGTFLLIDGANVQTVGTRILVKNEGNAAWNGVYTYTNATTITRSADTDTYGPTSTTDLSLNDYFFVQAGDVNEGSAYVCTTVGTITFGTTNITFALFSTSQVYDAGTGLTLTNTTFSVNPSQTQVTAVGTLTSLSVSGNANIGNIGTAGLITATGNLGAGNVNTTGVFATTLSATGNANVGNIGTAGLITATGNITGGNIVTAGTANAAILTVSGNANIGNIGTAGLITATGNITGGNLVTSGTANAAILTVSGNANIGNIGTGGLITATGNITGGNIITSGVMSSTGNVTGGNIVTGGLITATGNVTGGNVIATNGANVGTILGIGNGTVNTSITWASVTTSAITANQTIANISVTGVTGIEYLVKAVDSAGSKYSVATVQAVTDGTSVDYATFGTVQLGGYTGSLAVNVSGGYIKLQVTPASTNSTVWTTQYRLI